MFDPSANRMVFLGYKKDLKGYKLWNPKNKKFVLGRHVTLNKASVVKPTVSWQVKLGKTKLGVSQLEESDASSHSPGSSVCSVSVRISPIVTLGRDRVVLENTEHIEVVVSVAARRTKKNLRK